ncbi:MAG TPA: Txe/YoeB family addiction module toxin [Hanamia sp.]|jgi:toxin-antitoxin system, toxin component, Txe/YoeB family
MRKIVFVDDALNELNDYKFSQPKLVFKVFELITDIDKTPYTGLGKPEPLKGSLHGYWSRRVSDEHRLVYKVSESEITVFSCRSHYNQF